MIPLKMKINNLNIIKFQNRKRKKLNLKENLYLWFLKQIRIKICKRQWIKVQSLNNLKMNSTKIYKSHLTKHKILIMIIFQQ